MILNDDCLKVMKNMESDSIDMIYLDPPFFTQKSHSLKNKSGIEYSFNDTWESLDHYLDYLKVRLIEAKRILKETGSIFLHCDNSASHYLRILLDEIFGINNFRSEIIWTYRRWSNSKNGLLNSHQNIYFYSKTDEFKFRKVLTDYSPTTNVDQILQDRVRNESGKTIYRKDEVGNIIFTNEKIGVPLSDVWEIPFLNPKAKERVGYPTQKPILLLERIIEISTDINDTILDPFCGSGTTLVAAKIMNRNYIGIDINSDAIMLASQRLINPIKTESKLLKVGKDAYDQKSRYEKIILSNFECNIVQRNKGIDAFLIKHYKDSPVAIRIQKESEPLSTAIDMLNRAGTTKKCKLMILIRTNNFENRELTVPSNIIIIDSYQLTIDSQIADYDRYLDNEI